MLGLVIYLSSVAVVPQSILLLTFVVVLYRIIYILKLNIYFDKKEVIGYLFILISIIFVLVIGIYPGTVVGNLQSDSLLGSFPFLILIGFSIFLGKFLTIKDLKLIQCLLFIEILVACYEYMAGISSIFTFLDKGMVMKEEGLLYDNRVFGLSSNSSALAIKLLISYMIYFLLKKESSKLFNVFVLTVLGIGLFLTFNRSVILALILSYFLMEGLRAKKLLFLTIPMGGVAWFYYDDILYQVARGGTKVTLSGREDVYSYFFGFIWDNPWFGNAGAKLWVKMHSVYYHAHNSYLELIASNGLLVSIIFLLGCIFIFYKSSKIMLPILICSLAQYCVFWGLSYYDIVVAGILYIYIDKRRTEGKLAKYSS